MINGARLAELKAAKFDFSPRELKVLTPEHSTAVLLADASLKDLIDAFQDVVRERLLKFMTSLSLQYADNPWEDGLEYSLWEAVQEGPVKMTPVEVRELTRLAEWAGGWYHFPHEAPSPEFIEAEAWQAHYKRYVEYQDQLRRSTSR